MPSLDKAKRYIQRMVRAAGRRIAAQEQTLKTPCRWGLDRHARTRLFAFKESQAHEQI